MVTRYWVQGFLAGNLPPAPLECDENGPEMLEWSQAAKDFAETGEWTLDDSDDADDAYRYGSGDEIESDDDHGATWVQQADGRYVRVTEAAE